ncbi:PASTA domain-containing protein [Motilibacter deserti]|uniref:PASTA domain-containing protein n=1 Tax=Motilibacter deserti TaxID=2714956 RepID=A0ABX0GY57_9ACTN|nr:PASTA domain-containing protein [Motilibacter deserti]NHC14611.1 PASTA domain-containing protein [Motilibacter deserti]
MLVVPGVAGLSLGDAVSALADAGLSFAGSSSAFADTIPRG